MIHPSRTPIPAPRDTFLSASAARTNLGLKFPATQNLLGVLVSGNYYFTSSPGGSTTSATHGNGTLRLVPWWVPNDVTLSRIGAELTVIGQTGSVVRLGIYADNGDCYPGALTLDAGTLDGVSATVQEITISQALTAGLYWIGGAVQSAPTTQPTVRVTNNWTQPFATSLGASAPSASATLSGYSQTSVTGALPANFTASITPVGAAIRVFVKVA